MRSAQLGTRELCAALQEKHHSAPRGFGTELCFLLAMSQLELQSEFSCDHHRAMAVAIIILWSSQAGVSLLFSLHSASHPRCVLSSCVSQWDSNPNTNENMYHRGEVVVGTTDTYWMCGGAPALGQRMALTALCFCRDHHVCMLRGA